MDKEKSKSISISQLLSMIICTLLLILYVTLVTWVF